MTAVLEGLLREQSHQDQDDVQEIKGNLLELTFNLLPPLPINALVRVWIVLAELEQDELLLYRYGPHGTTHGQCESRENFR